MSNASFLEFQYKLSKNKFLRKPSRMLSSRSRQNSSSSIPIMLQPSVKEMRQVFNKFDSNGDGKISQQEYKAMLRALGQEFMIPDVPKIFKVADLDGDGFIDFNEFAEAQRAEAQRKEGGVRTMDLQSAFRTFDANGDGRISAEEVLGVLRQLGDRCNLEDCRRMVRAVDSDGDGLVNIDEFTTMMTRTLVHNN